MFYETILQYYKTKDVTYDTFAQPLLDKIIQATALMMKIIGTGSFFKWFDSFLSPIITNLLKNKDFEDEDSIHQLETIEINLRSIYKTYSYDKLKQNINQVVQITIAKNKNTIEGVSAVYFSGKDGFQDAANSLIDQLREEDRIAFFEILELTIKTTGSKPSAKYLKEANAKIDAWNTDKFKAISQQLFDVVISLKETVTEHQVTYNSGNYTYNTIDFLDAANTEMLKGLIWMQVRFHDNTTTQSISRLAERSYKKIPQKSAASTMLGNACLYVLANSKGLNGISQLSRLKLKIKLPSILTLIDKYIQETAIKLKITTTEVEDLAVDNFKLQEGKLLTNFDDFTAIITLTGIGKSTLTWQKDGDKIQKTVPQVVKDKSADKLKKLKSKQKQIDQATSAQKERIDRMLRTERQMTIEYFTQHYINHALLSFVIKHLIYCFTSKDSSTTAIYINGKWITLDYKEIQPENFEKVQLWHPVNSTTEEVRLWRQFLMDSEIQQPLKQAYREIYIVTDAEIKTQTYSNRMASHILRQHQFNSLAKGRNWHLSLMGAWDGGMESTPTLQFTEQQIMVEYWINALNADNEWNDSGIWNYITTDQVRFIDTKSTELIPIANVPAVVFSEAMRDIDLFVGVASVGNDPTWSDSGGLPIYRDYWQSYSFGDLSEVAKNRKSLLEMLVPRLKIKDVTTIEGNFLVVKGKLRTYKIHIGSTNILMHPNDQYLCIVADRKQNAQGEKVFLPFEGDTGLSIIISKAFLLADDDKITDTTITTQISRN